MKVSHTAAAESPVAGTSSGEGGAKFAKMMSGLAGQVAGAAGSIESASRTVSLGTSDPTEIATTIAQAELMLESVVAIRDKVIALYNDLVRTPI